MEKEKKRKKIISIILWTLGILVFAWFILLVMNYYFVKKDRRPILCWNYQKEIYDEDEYSLTCNGVLYKYREYYYKDSNKLNARELTMFFTDFKREK